MRKLLFIIILLGSFSLPLVNHAQIDDTIEIDYLSGEVIGVTVDEYGSPRYETKLPSGEVILLDSFGDPLVIGSKVYLERFVNEDIYNFVTIKRTPILAWVFGLFVLFVLLLTRKKGLRSLFSLGMSFVLLIFGLIPMLMNGFDPVVTSLVFGLCVLFLSIFVTHGFNRQSLVSFLGSFVSILVAVALLLIITKTSFITGFVSHDVQFLSTETEGMINLIRLFIAAVIIGTLGVLDDITITQVAVVRELSENEKLSRFDIFRKALNVGRDHVSSLVNTLIFAYIGATLPLIMFITLLEIPFLILISQEFIFVEIIRSLVGAIALVIAVPITTWLAVYVFKKAIGQDAHTIDAACAHHHH